MFARPMPTPEQREAGKEARRQALVHGNRGFHRGTTAGATTGPAPKECALKSPAYERAVRNLGYCVRCRKVCRPQFCHRDEGKGTGIKTDVRQGWAGCADCHYFVGTSGSLPREQRRAEDLRLGRLTRQALRQRGTWPPSVPDLGEA